MLCQQLSQIKEKVFTKLDSKVGDRPLLVSILAGAGDITTYRRSWRENY